MVNELCEDAADAPDEAAARAIMEEDPTIQGGFARGELRPFRVTLLRGRDDVLPSDDEESPPPA